MKRTELMRVEDWFSVALRVVGVLILVSGLGLLLDSLLLKLGYFFYPDSSPGYYLIAGSAQVAVGIYLARGAPLLLAFAYPTEDEDESGGEGDSNE
jgi:hypothetical protein